jgi:hypothetical protein
MSPHQAIAVAVRIFAVWLAIYVLRTIPAFFIQGRGDTGGLVAAAIVVLLTLGVALLLWFFPLITAQKLLSSPVAGSASSATPDTWLAMGCALIGLWLLSSAIPTLVRDGLVLYYAGSHYDDTSTVKHWIIYNLVQILVATWLIFGARGFRRAFWWAQTAGVKKASNQRLERP